MLTAIGSTWIEKAPGVCGGRARVRKSRIAVWHLVEMRQHGLTDTDILVSYPEALTQDDLEMSWRYYTDNKAEIVDDVRQNTSI